MAILNSRQEFLKTVGTPVVQHRKLHAEEKSRKPMCVGGGQGSASADRVKLQPSNLFVRRQQALTCRTQSK